MFVPSPVCRSLGCSKRSVSPYSPACPFYPHGEAARSGKPQQVVKETQLREFGVPRAGAGSSVWGMPGARLGQRHSNPAGSPTEGKEQEKGPSCRVGHLGWCPGNLQNTAGTGLLSPFLSRLLSLYLSMFLPLYLSPSLSLSPFLYLSPSLSLSAFLSLYPCLALLLYLSLFLSPSPFLSLYLSLSPFLCLSHSSSHCCPSVYPIPVPVPIPVSILFLSPSPSLLSPAVPPAELPALSIPGFSLCWSRSGAGGGIPAPLIPALPFHPWEPLPSGNVNLIKALLVPCPLLHHESDRCHYFCRCHFYFLLPFPPRFYVNNVWIME